MAIAAPPLFPWSDDTYSVKIGLIDTQHKNLVNIINELHQAMLERQGKERLGGTLSSLIQYTQAHFRTEEHFLELHQYPEYDRHKTEHANLTRTVLDFQRKFEKNEVGLTTEVMGFLKDWLSHHIVDTDRKYGPFLNAKGLH